MTEQQYDIIGDIHGHCHALTTLLAKLGYKNSKGYYSHPERKVIFLGDFIDRGPDQEAVLDVVMNMVNNKSALAVMGNHEFNALAYHTHDPDSVGEWLRPHIEKNTNQHQAFLDEFLLKGKEDKLVKVLDFFLSLPLWLEFENLRIVHACWNAEHIEAMEGVLGSSIMLTKEVLVQACRKGTDEYLAIETLLKGIEVELPDGHYFLDNDKNKRTAVRARWWLSDATSYGEVSMPQGKLSEEVSNMQLPASYRGGYDNKKPVFIGHYWMQGTPAPLSHYVTCLDYSVAKQGQLVAYQWAGEKELSEDCFVTVDMNDF